MSAAAFFLLCASFVAGQAVDQTRVAESRGATVVKAAVAQIQRSGIFPDDHSFLRRIAYVESRDGTHPGTYRARYHGGIWQVDLVGFQSTQNTAHHPSLVVKHREIRMRFGIDWSTVQWMDLRKPLFSALAARLFLSNIRKPIPSDLMGQAAYWKMRYNTPSGHGTERKFINDVNTLEKKEL